MPPPPPLGPPAAAVLDRAPDPRATLVLLVDDNGDSRTVYGECLRRAGSRVIEAVNGRDALDEAVRRHPDIILMDLEMPVMDGHEATRRLKTDTRTRDIPIVILTSCRYANAVDATADGANAYLLKPCSAQDLEAVVDALGHAAVA